ncbi:MAG TPA: preprotein translocase subunit YajC [bacterium]|nr:preprotein translocase subunit YajC [bacterium]
MGAIFNMLVPFVLIFVIFYFLVVMPQKKQQKKLQEMLGSLQKGDRVITSSGIFGRVTEVRNDSFKIEIAPKVVVSVQKSAVISRVAEDVDPGEGTETK